MIETNNAPPTAGDNTAATPDNRRSAKRTFFLAGGAVLAAAVLTGGGVALGAAIRDDYSDDDNRTVADEAVNGNSRIDSRNDKSSMEQSGNIGSTSAEELMEVVDAAAKVSDGDPVGIDAERDGSWDVQLRTSTGDETEVRVTSDLTATVTSSERADADDTAPHGTLDRTTVQTLVNAALTESSGRIVELGVDNDPVSPYDITVITNDARAVNITFTADLTILTIEFDD